MCLCLTHLRNLLCLDENQQRSRRQRHLSVSMRTQRRQGSTMTTLPFDNLQLKRRLRAKELPDSTPDIPPLETSDGMLVDLPLSTPNIVPSVMSQGKKRKEPDAEPTTRLKSLSPVMRTPSPDVPDLFLVSPKTPPSYNSPVSFPSPAPPTIGSQLFSSHSHSHSPPSPPPAVSKSVPEMKSGRNLNSPQNGVR